MIKSRLLVALSSNFTIMISISDLVEQITTCPVCGSNNRGRRLDFYGKYVLLNCTCINCKSQYIHTAALGHSVDFPISFSADTTNFLYSKAADVWHARPLINAFKDNKTTSASIEKVTFSQTQKVVVLNCLDDCYGHVLWGLFNAHRHLKEHAEFGLVVIIPKSFKWLVPKGVSEIWSLDIRLSSLNNRIDGFDDWITREFTRFSHVHLSKRYTQLDHHKIALEDFTKTKSFDLTNFNKKPFRIVYILRDDRFWLSHRWMTFLHKVTVKYWQGLLNPFFIWVQNRLINKTAQQLSKRLDIEQYAVGIGKRGGLSRVVSDQRNKTIDEKTEKNWCEIYAGAHVVIGVHGSNMMIPTSLAAGFVEIVTDDKVAHFTEDILLRHNNRLLLFLGRYLPQTSKSVLVVNHIISMLTGFERLYKSTHQ